MKHVKHSLWMLFASCTVLGCGSSSVPVTQLADAESSIRAAHEVGAEGTPDAALQLKMARDRLARAKALSAQGENDEARALLQEAEVDAELALLLTRKEQASHRAFQAESRGREQAKEQESKTSEIKGEAP
jgi:hypothetical protein